MKIALIILFLILFPITDYGQLQNRGEGVFKLSFQLITSDRQFNSEAKLSRIRTNSLYTTNLYVDYNFTSRTSAAVSFIPFARAAINSIQYNQSGNRVAGSALNSLGDSEIRLKYIIRNKLPIYIACFMNFGLPLGKRKTLDPETALYTGDGEFNQMAGVQLIQTFSSFTASGYFAYNNRANGYSNDVRYGGEIVFKQNRYKITGRFNAIESLFNDDAPVDLNGIFSNHRELFAPGAELQFFVSKQIGILVAMDFVVSGRNTLSSPLFEGGVVYKKL